MSIIIDKPNGISLFQAMAARSAIKLQALGMKHSRMNVRKVWAIHLGLKPNAKCEVVIAALDKKIEEIKALGDLGITNTDEQTS